MKLTNTRNVIHKSGMTLLELTVVILVLLSLISILFIGARAWKKGSDRAANILNVRNVQQAVRAHANIRGLATPGEGGAETGGAVSATTDIFNGGYIKAPTSPLAGVAYVYGTAVPAVGTLYVQNPDLGTTAGSGEYFYSTAEAGKIADW
ncbi:MAG: prepilin-type N-terminal cleavage/methylation domain-containing protein [Verrucomicrobiaceae bacterium]|nr:MAG: prepilin-type N-terminal cleavage/methylation domain-containing protein [Verrucomicrobiaceae bacterium]